MKIDTLLVSKVILLGDREAFNRLVEAYQSPVRRFFFNLTGGDEELSKDLAQDTFVKAWLNIGSFRSGSTGLRTIRFMIIFVAGSFQQNWMWKHWATSCQPAARIKIWELISRVHFYFCVPTNGQSYFCSTWKTNQSKQLPES